MISSFERPSSSEQLTSGALAGTGEGLGELLERHRGYLTLLASLQVDAKLRARFSASDVVQETLFEAYRDFGQFRGRTETELLAWLRQILLHNVAHMIEHHVLAAKRNARREVSLKALGTAMEESAARLETIIAASIPSPSADARRREHAVILAEHLERLPCDYRDVLVLRHLKGLAFEEVASRMGRSAGAVRMLWLRALERLRRGLRTRGLS